MALFFTLWGVYAASYPPHAESPNSSDATYIGSDEPA
jgi:hypothetical protein